LAIQKSTSREMMKKQAAVIRDSVMLQMNDAKKIYDGILSFFW
jgi:hypothetical protein